MSKINPLGDRVVLKRSEAPKTKGGIFLPDSAQEKPREGVVIAAGPGARNESGQLEAITVKKGDRVLFGAYAGTEFKENDEEYLIISEKDILGILS